MSKLISTFKISFDDETKAEISALKDSLDAVSNRLKAGNIIPTGGLLAANDVPAPDLKQLGQWVFEGQDEKWQSAAINNNGQAYRHNYPLELIHYRKGLWVTDCFAKHEMELIPGEFSTGCLLRAVQRETVNDVDYLSETVPEIQGTDAREIIIDDLWQDKPAPQITQADMQLIFIKNLSDVLIQRMHSMGRFSKDGREIGRDNLLPWDIVYDQVSKFFGVVTNANDNILSAFFLKAHCEMTGGGCAHNFHKNSLLSRANRTITEAELPVFRTALEAYHA